MLSLLLATAAHGACLVDAVETAVNLGAGKRVDTWTLYADTGELPCRALTLPPDPGGTLRDVQIRITHADDTRTRLGVERVAPSWTDQRIADVVHLPELRHGDSVRLTVSYALPQRGQMAWRPGWFGAVEAARLKPGKLGAGATAAWTEATPAAMTPGPATAGIDGVSAPDAATAAWTLTWGDAAGASTGAPTTAPRGALHITLALSPDLEARRLEGEPPSGRTRITRRRTLEPGEATGHVVPADAEDIRCAVAGQAVPLTGRVCRLSHPAASAAAVEGLVAWTEPRLRLAGRFAGPDIAADQVTVRIEGEGIRWATGDASEAQTGASEWSSPGWTDTGDRLVQPSADPQLSWWVTHVGDDPVLSTREAVVDVVALQAIRASMPEPALPVPFKNRKADPSVTVEVVEFLQRQVRTGSLPGAAPLRPRLLMEARRTGFASSWEQALMLTRYLRQLKLDALPLPVQPDHGPAPSPAQPTGYSEAVVQVRGLPEGDLWIDPTCRMCALGELPPRLSAGWTLSDSSARLPEAAPGHTQIVRTVSAGIVTTRVHLEGAAALALREALLAVKVSARPAWLATRFGGDKLTAHEGLATRGAPVTLTVSGDEPEAANQRPPWWPEVDPTGSADVIWPWTGAWSWTTSAPGAPTPSQSEGPGATWTLESTTVDGAHTVTETLKVQTRRTARPATHAWLSEIDHARAQAWAPPEPATPPADGDGAQEAEATDENPSSSAP